MYVQPKLWLFQVTVNCCCACCFNLFCWDSTKLVCTCVFCFLGVSAHVWLGRGVLLSAESAKEKTAEAVQARGE